MANRVTISGMFGAGHTYFADSPVVITISGLQFPETSPFKIVHVEVVYQRLKSGGGYDSVTVGDFRCDTGGQTTVSFDIATALKNIWLDYDYTGTNGEIAKATAALTGNSGQTATRNMRQYALRIYTEYMAGDDGGVFTTTQCTDSNGNTDIPGGQCVMGGYSEWERSLITNDADRDVSYLEHKGVRNGDASTKPTSSPEHIGSDSITSWVDVKVSQTQSIFFPASYNNGVGEADDPANAQAGTTRPDGKTAYDGHAPIVLRDSQSYVDFLFTNRRGAIETCSGLTKEAMGINNDVQQYSRTGGPSFWPSPSLMAIGKDGRRSWQMSSGFVTREWAEWWAMEFIGGKRKQWWMRWHGPNASSPKFVPVTIKPANSNTTIYDRTNQKMAHVDFTVTLAFEG